jgi:hypothetical protein
MEEGAFLMQSFRPNRLKKNSNIISVFGRFAEKARLTFVEQDLSRVYRREKPCEEFSGLVRKSERVSDSKRTRIA